jgi:hypothetical protein
VRSGLISLGWQAREADQAIAVVEPELLAAASAAASPAPGSGAGDGETGAGAGGGRAGGQRADGQTVDVAIALRAALRVLGRT